MKNLFRLGVLLAAGLLLYGAYELFGARIQNAYYTRAAEQAHAANDLTRAAELYEKILDRQPRDEKMRLLVSGLYSETLNYTRAEHVVKKGIQTVGPSAALYAELCALYIAQDKLQDAVELLDGINSPAVREEIAQRRPSPPVFSMPEGEYEEWVEVLISAEEGCAVYASWEGGVPSVATGLVAGSIALKQGFTQVRAVAVSQDGLVSDWAQSEYHLGNIVEQVVFTDPAVERLIREAAGKPEEQVYTSDLWQIESLISDQAEEYTTLSDLLGCVNLKTLRLTGQREWCDISVLPELKNLTELALSSFGIDAVDLEWVGKASALERLALPDNNIGSVAALEPLRHLTGLDISYNSVLDISPLAALKSLQILNLSQNAVQDLTAISSMTGLRALSVSENRVTTLRGLEPLTELTLLDVSKNPGLSSVALVAGLTSLETLTADNCLLETLPDLSGLNALAEVSVAGNKLGNLDGLEGVTTLKRLVCSDNSLSSLAPLAGCTGLVMLDASRNGITSVDALRALPSLTEVRLESNALTTIQPLKECPSLKKVYALNNPLSDSLDAFTGTGIDVIRQ